MPRRRGALVLIVGPDGVGKSSLAEGLAAAGLAGHAIVRLHQRARLLPRHTHHDGPVREPHAAAPYARWLAVLKVAYMYVDVVLGWLIRLRPAVRRGDVVLLERGWWDLVVDPRRYRLRGIGALARALGRLMPRPDLVLVLEAPPDLIRGRVPELPEPELARQIAAWRTVIPRGIPCVILDASRAPELVREAATEAISTQLRGPQALGNRASGNRARRLATFPFEIANTVIRRAGWGFADQALSSLTNFLVGFVIARSVSPAAFGAYALVFAIYILVLNGSRAVSSLPLTIRFSAASESAWRSASADAAGLALLTGTAAGIACLGVSLVAPDVVREAFLALAVTLPGLILQDMWRFAFFARGTGRDAFLNDGVWLVLQIPLFGALLATGKFSVGLAVLAWGGSATLAALAGMWQARARPQLRRARAWWQAQRDIASRLLGEALTSTGGETAQPYGITAVAGLPAVGALRAGELLLGPFNVIFQGTTLVAIPEGARLLVISTGRLVRACLLFSAGLAASALAWTTFVLLIPNDVGAALLRQNWEPARSVLLPLSIGLIGLAATAGATIGMRALAAVRRSLRTRILTTIIGLVSTISGAALGGAVGAAIAIAVASWVVAAIWWWQFRTALGEFVAPVAASDPPRDQTALPTYEPGQPTSVSG
jgi:O-antigen/teichoic acid export membrane protein/thymidylate kinase